MDEQRADTSKILFFHGKESGPHGSKYHALSEYFAVESPDFRDLDIHERLEKARELTEDAQEIFLVGSSYGGLLAALLYNQHPERFRGYVLMAPALHHPAADAIERTPPRAQGVIIHGVSDEIVPIEASRVFAARHDLELIEVEDDHRLKDSADLMCAQVRRLLAN